MAGLLALSRTLLFLVIGFRMPIAITWFRADKDELILPGYFLCFSRNRLTLAPLIRAAGMERVYGLSIFFNNVKQNRLSTAKWGCRSYFGLPIPLPRPDLPG